MLVTLPAAHGMGCVAPVPQDEPAVHGRQLASSAFPSMPEKRPAAHGTQAEAPGVSPNLPDGHAMHDLFVTLAVARLNVPDQQGSGSLMPSRSAYVPDGALAQPSAHELSNDVQL